MSVVFMDCKPLPNGITGWRDQVVLDNAAYHAEVSSNRQTRTVSAVKLQSHIRCWVARVKYLRHLTELRKDVARLAIQRETSAAIVAQKAIRVLFARRKLTLLRQEARLKASQEESGGGGGKKGKKGKGAAAAATVAAPVPIDTSAMSTAQILIELNKFFIEGVVHFLQGRMTDALTNLNQHVAANPQDGIAIAVIKRINNTMSGAGGGGGGGGKGDGKQGGKSENQEAGNAGKEGKKGSKKKK